MINAGKIHEVDWQEVANRSANPAMSCGLYTYHMSSKDIYCDNLIQKYNG